jgi:hypothetical protein
MIQRPSIAALLACGMVFLNAWPARADPRAVVELFTSQGCSSCPPADAFLEELAGREDVIGLSFHVDYWDYLGWKDTLGRPENSERQAQYSAMRGDRKVYTPQMIVNGGGHFLGGDRASIEKAIAEARLPVPVTVSYHDEKIKISVGPSLRPAPWQATIRLVLYSSVATVQIAGGENQGSTITYRNVVRDMRPIGMWDGPMVRVKLPADELLSGEADGCVVLVQEDLESGPGAILGAAQIKIPEG